MSLPIFGGSMYDSALTAPMRQELTRLGVESLETPEAVNEALGQKSGTVLVVVNSVCGCAAGNARPGVALALQHDVKPNRVVTVFAGVDREAATRAREHFVGYAPSSPQIALMKDGEVVFMLERHHIEGRDARQVASALTGAFDEHCGG